MSVVDVVQGDGPMVLGFPHTGTWVPEEIGAHLNENGRQLADTDWHVDRLYNGLLPDATTVRARFHRYVIDANRDPSGASLYPGQNTTGLVPLTDFDGVSIWATQPDAVEIEARRVAYHAAYHDALAAELERVKAAHGYAVLYDCHSIRSQIPFLFEGKLPDLNLGTNLGATSAPEIEAIAWEFAQSSPFDSVLNGRFKGGWTTRHYGRPGERIHAIQMEIAQCAYLSDERPPWDFDETRASRLRPWLKDILDALVDTATELHT